MCLYHRHIYQMNQKYVPYVGERIRNLLRSSIFHIFQILLVYIFTKTKRKQVNRNQPVFLKLSRLVIIYQIFVITHSLYLKNLGLFDVTY